MKAITIKHIVAAALLISVLGAAGVGLADNTMVRGYQKPEVCLTSNIRCILKKQGNSLYWCLKSNLQRNLDTRHTTSPIKKTRRGNLGNCAQIIPVRE
jgi:hypothetical protein